MSASAAAPPGWYPDPWGRAEWRWWDGRQWTPAVATSGSGWTDPPTAVGAHGPRTEPGGLRTAALGLAVAGLIGGFVSASLIGAAVLVVTGADATAPAVELASLFGLWVWLVGACVIASRRYGTGSLRTDLGLAWRWLDPLRGLGANLVARVVTTLVAIPIVAAGATSSNTTVVEAQKGSVVALVLIGAAAVIGAPIVEELFFRGLVLRSLTPRLGFGWAVVVQGLVFGLAHSNPAAGWRTLSLVAITAAFGMCQGWFARRWTLGPLMVSHALFNLLPVLVIALR